MRIIKNLLVIVFISVVIFFGSKNSVLMTALASVNLVFLSFNLIVRKKISFKPYFLSPYNIFSAKYSKDFEVEIPADLAFDKIVEVIGESGFKLVTADRERMQILAIASMGMQSWGENIYFGLEEVGDKTIVKFNSAALFQIYTWGKNEKNYSVFFAQLEDSFTI
jgi:hypothetical protein